MDIDPNAVRITHYYGCGYNYYSMGDDCKYHEDLLQVNKENGYASFENPGDGTDNGSYWNSTVVIEASGFRAGHVVIQGKGVCCHGKYLLVFWYYINHSDARK